MICAQIKAMSSAVTLVNPIAKKSATVGCSPAITSLANCAIRSSSAREFAPSKLPSAKSELNSASSWALLIVHRAVVEFGAQSNARSAAVTGV